MWSRKFGTMGLACALLFLQCSGMARLPSGHEMQRRELGALVQKLNALKKQKPDALQRLCDLCQDDSDTDFVFLVANPACNDNAGGAGQQADIENTDETDMTEHKADSCERCEDADVILQGLGLIDINGHVSDGVKAVVTSFVVKLAKGALLVLQYTIQSNRDGCYRVDLQHPNPVKK